MQVLVHVGLNKCASTYIQAALGAAQGRLRRAGVLYAVEGGRAAQYGVSRHYGFGPEVAGVTPRSLPWLAAEAGRRGCDRLILSSEYFSIARPPAIAAFARDLEALGAELRLLMFSREVAAWVRSLFNQHVKTVDGGPHFASINAFVDHTLKSGALDIVRRYRAWARALGEARIAHYHIAPATPAEEVLAPFAAFAGIPLAPAPEADANRSLGPGALYLTGLVRLAPPSPGRDLVLAAIAATDCAWVPVPPDYLEIDAERLARLEAEIGAPFATLPRTDLPTRRAA